MRKQIFNSRERIEIMKNEIHVKEINPINVENGVIINGFPSSGITSAIATESMINTSNFELGGIID